MYILSMGVGYIKGYNFKCRLGKGKMNPSNKLIEILSHFPLVEMFIKMKFTIGKLNRQEKKERKKEWYFLDFYYQRILFL